MEKYVITVVACIVCWGKVVVIVGSFVRVLLGSACCRYPQLGGLRSVSIVLLTVCVSYNPCVDC